MVVLLPKEMEGLADLESKLSFQNLRKWLGILRSGDVNVYLPKFKTTSQFELGGNLLASEQLLPLVYDELRQLAAAWLSKEKPGQTLQATALVHDAWLRLVDVDCPRNWENRRHFFAAAAEAMRRILVRSISEKMVGSCNKSSRKVALGFGRGLIT